MCLLLIILSMKQLIVLGNQSNKVKSYIVLSRNIKYEFDNIKVRTILHYHSMYVLSHHDTIEWHNNIASLTNDNTKLLLYSVHQN